MGWWRRIRAWRQWTLRTRMVVAIAALAGVGLILADVTGLLLMHQTLIQRVDTQVRAIRGGPFAPDRFREGIEPRIVVQSYTSTGQPFGDWMSSGLPSIGSFDELRPHIGQGPYTVDLPDGTGWRVDMRTFGGGYYAVGVSLSESRATERNLILIDVGLSGLVLLGIGLAAAAVVRVGLMPLTRMEDAAAEIAGGDLSRRVDDADPHTESGRLGLALNTMLVRIETAMADRTASEQRLRQFLADAAHELRTPLTSIQGFAELYRRGGVRGPDEVDEAMGAIDDEVGRMRLLVNDLLLLARLDEERPLHQSSVDLLSVAADAVRDAHLRVPTRFVLLGPLNDDDDTFDPVTVVGDEARLRQVATNLVANALQHTPDEAEIVVRVGRQEAGDPDSTVPAATVATAGDALDEGTAYAVLEVADTGPGMTATDAGRAFERLFRAEVSRSRRRGGAGLGLSIVASIVQAHGGRVELFTAPGEGARFRVLLPATSPGDDDEADPESSAGEFSTASTGETVVDVSPGRAVPSLVEAHSEVALS